MATKQSILGLTASPPTYAIKGLHNSLFMVIKGLGVNPPSGRLLRGLTPFLDEQGAAHIFLMTERRRIETWREEEGSLVEYTELVHWERNTRGGVYRGTVSKDTRLTQEEVLQAFEYEPLHLVEWAARRMGSAVVASDQPLVLNPLTIPKPWGQEVWFTGIEKRGVCKVRSSTGDTELPYALHLFPIVLMGAMDSPPILLKTLEPVPEPVYGDLYLEVHQEKWETYVVLDVDSTAWPDGIGYMRVGLASECVGEYQKAHGLGWDSALSKDLLEAIREYEKVRRDIDSRLEALEQDSKPQSTKPEGRAPVSPAQNRELLGQVAQALRDQEVRLREKVEKFLGRVPLKAGDVITLPPGVLHSLQHGIKVIEFQTPTYERLIAMFAQRVLTQDHWDSEEAIRLMQKAPYHPPAPKVLEEKDGLKVERIVEFPQFHVNRVRLQSNALNAQETEGENQYRLIYVIQGKGELVLPNGVIVPLERGQACLVPANMGEFVAYAKGGAGLTYLEAIPNDDGLKPSNRKASQENGANRVW
ncbi:MAG: hypothetical protein OEW39_12015 [Deltaproteobacteria bacterium]|nr:hypothetical protein [Deltaproteobacteria bacterium]